MSFPAAAAGRNESSVSAAVARAAVVVSVLLLAAGTGPAAAQTSSESGSGAGLQQRPTGGAGSYYYYAEPGDLTIQVSLWGTVRNPGRYEVKTGTDLGELLSFAGGPQMAARQQKEDRIITVRVSRPGEDRRRVIYEAEVDSMIVSSENYPQLQDGDIVTVETVQQPGFGWRDAMGVIGSAASIGVLILRIVEFSR